MDDALPSIWLIIIMASASDLPRGWICKESRSRPNQLYYFNTKTGKTQWARPDGKIDRNEEQNKLSKANEKSKTSTSHQNQHKINVKSKDLKKGKTKTPAQDRLDKLIKSGKTSVLESLKESFNSNSFPKSRSKTIRSTQTKSSGQKSNVIAKRSNDEIDAAISIPYVKSETKKSHENDVLNEIDTRIADEIPALFPSKNLAEKRLRNLQNNLSLNTSDCKHNATIVFGDSFGIDGNEQKMTTLPNSIDEEMEWEPCDSNVDCTFQQIESMAVDVLTDSAYIVPDTNVFLDSLASIKSIIEKEHENKILIPFVVLQELDQIKHRSDTDLLSSKASRAIRYIYGQLKYKNPRVLGQKATEDKAHIIDVSSSDDKILNCCLQLKAQSKDIILVTNDINLSNKALLSGVESITSKQCLEQF